MNQSSIDIRQPYLVIEPTYELQRWRPLVNWALYIPHAIILNALQILARVVFVVYWVMLVATGKLSPGLYGVMVMHERYNARAGSFLFGLSEQYPPFEFSTSNVDDGSFTPTRLSLPPLAESVPRSAALNVLKAIPHYVMLAIFGIGAAVILVIGWFAVLFTGAWPVGMRDFLVRVANYYYRVWAYVAMVDNDYPAFGLPSA